MIPKQTIQERLTKMGKGGGEGRKGMASGDRGEADKKE